MKYLGWDSRNFFFKLNKLLFNNVFGIFMNFIKDELVRSMLRFLIFLSIFKKKLLEMKFYVYMLHRLFAFCYLSLFYFFFADTIYLFNKWLIIIIIVIEFFLIIFIGRILEFFILTKNNILIEVMNILNYYKEIQLIIDPLTYTYFMPAKAFFEVNNQVWNIILGNSVSLNILKQYMLWVNKNTKGYYFYEMNILPKYNIKKLFEISSIPFDILPRTRYVIMQLRFVNNGLSNVLEQETEVIVLPDYRIKDVKNLYLSYFEKTYAVDSSLLSIIFLLRLNPLLNSIYLQEIYKKFLDEPCGIILNYIMLNQKSTLWRLRLAEINKANPELFNICYLLNSFNKNSQIYNIEYFFMLNFFSSNFEKKLSVISYNGSIKGYKENIKLLAHFVLYEEEGIVWNPNLFNHFEKIENVFDKDRKIYDELFLNIYKEVKEINFCLLIEDLYETVEALVDPEIQIKEFYKFEFNKDIEILNFNNVELKELDFKIISINSTYQNVPLIQHFLEVVEDLELLMIEDLKDSRYFFLFED